MIPTLLQRLSLGLLVPFFVVAGAMHFVRPEAYLPLMPPILPAPLTLIYISGAAEILGGIGLVFRDSRRCAGIWLILLLLAVFPANIYMLTARPLVLGMHPPEWILWARLPLQALLIMWIWWASDLPRTAAKRK